MNNLSGKIYSRKWINHVLKDDENPNLVLANDVRDFIKQVKSRIGYRFSGGHSDVLDKCSEEIDKLAGEQFVVSVKDEVKD